MIFFIPSRVLRAALLSSAFSLCVSVPVGAFGREPPVIPAPADPAPANPQTEAAKAWNFAASDVPVDRDILFGILPNGMRYALHRNSTPKDSVIMRLRIDTGSFSEAEDQRGLAHFLEHMAFNGSTNVPEGEMIKLLERKGLAFGADTNASTGFDETVYKLDLPNASDDLVDTGLMLLRETAGELLIDPAAVDRERGVILSERRARDTYQLRNAVDQLEFFYPGTLLPARLPVGTEEVIKSAPAQRIRDFYDYYYRPSHTTLIIAGDFDPALMGAKLTARFGDWQGRGVSGPAPDIGALDFARGPAADIFVHPAIGDGVSISWLKPYVDEPDTLAKRRRELAEAVGEAVVQRRLSRIAMSADAPFSSAGFSSGGAWKLFDSIGVSANAREGAWKESLVVIENELRRAATHGFTDAEVAEQISEIHQNFRNAAESVETRRSQTLADRLVTAAKGEDVVTTPAFRLRLFEEVLPTLNADSVIAAFRARTKDVGPPLIRVTGKSEIAGGEAAVLAAYVAATEMAVSARAEDVAKAFAYTDFGKPGKIVADDRIADLGIRRLRFANNVMLNIKRTDFEKDRVRIQLRIDGGNLLNTREDPTKVALVGGLALGGLEAHSLDELRTIVAGRTIGYSITSGADFFGASGTTTPKDFALQAQVLAAFITHPGYRPEALDLLRRIFPQQYAANDATPAAVIARDVSGILANDDPRFATAPLDRMMALDWDGLKPAIADALANGAIEIGVVGDIDEQAAIDAIAATFGALPKRRAAFDPKPDARKVAFATDRSTRTLIHKGEADQAVVQTYWQARDDKDLPESMRMALLGEVMGLMLTDELREKLGKTYSPGAGAALSDDFPGYGHVYASSNVDIADVAAVEGVVDAIAETLRTKAVDADLLDRARKPFLEQLVKSRRENGYWLPYVARAGSDAARLDRSRKAIAEVEAATPDDLLALAQRYLVPERAIRIRAVSDKPVASSPPKPLP